jgi:hypothetical protein
VAAARLRRACTATPATRSGATGRWTGQTRLARAVPEATGSIPLLYRPTRTTPFG